MNAPIGLTDYFYRTLVPSDPWQVVEFRKWCLEKAWADEEFAQELWIMCARDFLFYVNVFGWLLEPRDKPQWQQYRTFGNAREIPFVTREYQDTDARRMLSALGVKDMSMKKSREMGATWFVLYMFDWAWRFHPQQHFGVISKDEDSAGSAEDPDSLLSKMNFIHEHLPDFLKGNRDWNKSKMTLKNSDNGSTVTAYACTGNAARGGRKRAFFLDEVHAWPAHSDYSTNDSLQHVTNCRIFVSTPNRDRGPNGLFYDVIQNDTSDMERFEWSWMIDKNKATGLYWSDGNTIEYGDQYPYPQGYRFVRDGKQRSPYYDYECNRPGATEQSIAAELDMDFGGATSRFFQTYVIYKARGLTLDPTHWAELRKEHGEWLPQLMQCDHLKEMNIELWIDHVSGITFASGGRLIVPSGREYGMGVDVAMGTGGAYSSNSAFGIIDKKTCTQVAEFRFGKITPQDYAAFAYQVGMIFNRALMCIEVTGPGQGFLTKIMEIGYTNLWLRPRSVDDIKRGLSSKVGYDNKDGGKVILGELQDGINRDLVVIRSKRTIEDCGRYYIDANGNLKHPLVGKGRTNAPEKSHGDSAIACAAAWFGMRADPEWEEAAPAKEEIPYQSAAWRREQRQSQANTCRWWDPEFKLNNNHTGSTA